MNADGLKIKELLVKAGIAGLRACSPNELQSTNVFSKNLRGLSAVEQACARVLWQRFQYESSTDVPKQLKSDVLHVMGWAFSGFPVVRISGKLAASFAMTNAPTEFTKLPLQPWSSFMIDLPSSVFTSPEVGELHFALCSPRGFGQGSLQSIEFLIITKALKFGLALDHFEKIDVETITDSERQRIHRVIGRIYAGVNIELANRQQDIKACEAHARKFQNRKSKYPTAWDFVLGKDVHLDCRQAVRDYLARRGQLLSVQSLVRGHYKWQPCGPELKERKWIHIEPYWRGPEDAPIVIRDHVLEGS